MAGSISDVFMGQSTEGQSVASTTMGTAGLAGLRGACHSVRAVM